MINDENAIWPFLMTSMCYVDEVHTQVLVQHKHPQRQHYQDQYHLNHQDHNGNPEHLQNEPKER